MSVSSYSIPPPLSDSPPPLEFNDDEEETAEHLPNINVLSAPENISSNSTRENSFDVKFPTCDKESNQCETISVDDLNQSSSLCKPSSLSPCGGNDGGLAPVKLVGSEPSVVSVSEEELESVNVAGCKSDIDSDALPNMTENPECLDKKLDDEYVNVKCELNEVTNRLSTKSPDVSNTTDTVLGSNNGFEAQHCIEEDDFGDFADFTEAVDNEEFGMKNIYACFLVCCVLLVELKTRFVLGYSNMPQSIFSK